MSNKISAAITALGAYVPEYKLTNAELETMVETSDEWIKTRTGVEERRILKGENMGVSKMAVPAVKELCRKRGIDPIEIDCLICCTVTPDMTFPATANIITYEVGASNAFGFDLSAACSGFLFGVTTGASLIESGRYKKVVVVGTDKMSGIVDYSDRKTCVLFGDAAGAILLGTKRRRLRNSGQLIKNRWHRKRVFENGCGRFCKACFDRNGNGKRTLHFPGRAGRIQVCGKRNG